MERKHHDDNQSECPDLNTLATFLEGALDEEEQQLVDSHIRICQRCREIFTFGEKTRQSQIERSASQTQSTDLDPLLQKLMPFGQLSTGQTIGRYIVVTPLGLGGMGEVYSAYDPELNRRVALKLLRTDVFADSTLDNNVSRLMKEAQAMAQLSHPNVISVHDVIRVDGQVVIAMEYFSGGTLKSWLREQPRNWREIVDAFVAAGQGLAAAHAAKLVHRDFKPSNVLLEEDGRVCVTDFGLVRGLDQDEHPETKRSLTISNRLDETLTKTGAYVGTPAYMSPEQLLGEKSDTRSDQFGFCVALFEALYGQRPFSGETTEELKESILSGEIAPVESTKEVPTWLYDIVKRGLEVKPEDRYPSMDALLVELRHDPEEEERKRRALRIRRLGWTTIILLAVVLPVGVWYGMRYRTVQLCKDTSREFSGIWDNATKDTVKSAFIAIGKPYVQGTWKRVVRIFDNYLDDWKLMRSDICEARHIHGTESEDLFDRRMSCLKKRKQELKALTKVFSNADRGVVEKAVNAGSSLIGIKICADESALRSPYLPPKTAGAKEEVAAIRKRLVEIDALKKTGKYQKALELAKKLNIDATATNYKPIQAESSLLLGELLRQVAEYEKAETTLYEAVRLAGESRDGLLAAKAKVELVTVVGLWQARSKESLSIGQDAETLLNVVGGDERTRSALYDNLGLVLRKQGEYSRALDNHQRALAIYEKTLGPKHPNVAWTMTNIGSVLDDKGKYDKALGYYRKALAIYENSLGPDHPEVAATLHNLASGFVRINRYEEALQYLKRALANYEKALGPEHPSVAASLGNVGVILLRQGKYDEALPYMRRVLALYEKKLGPEKSEVATALLNLGSIFKNQGKLDKALEYYRRALLIYKKVLGPEHPYVATTLRSIGNIFSEQGKFDEALDNYRSALTIQEKTLEPDHPSVASSLNNQGKIFWIQGRYKKALGNLRSALTIREKALGPDHPDVAETLSWIGVVFVAQGRAKKALEFLERSAAICGKKECDPISHGHRLFALARALVATGGDRARAVRLARQARIALGEITYFKKEIREVNAWLKKHKTP